MEDLKLNIGCGPTILDGWVNIDKFPMSDQVVVIDLEKGKLPYKDNSVLEIRATHVLEHIWNLQPLLNECWRVLKPEGAMYVEVPCFPHPDCAKDPDHKRFFTAETFWGYFDRYLAEGLFPMYGYKRWKVLNLTESSSQINVLMKPAK